MDNRGDQGQDPGALPPPPGGGQPQGDYPGGTGWQEIGGAGPAYPGGGGPSDPASSPFPPPRRRGRVGMVLRVGVVVVLGGIALASFLGRADRDDEGAVDRAGELSAMDLRVGDCFDDPGDAPEVAAVQAVPCAEPHDNEVFHEFQHPDADSPPSQDAAFQRIGEECIPAFNTFVGKAYEESELDFFTFEPTEAGWREGDRTVQCSVYAMDGSKLTGTARGAAR